MIDGERFFDKINQLGLKSYETFANFVLIKVDPKKKIQEKDYLFF